MGRADRRRGNRGSHSARSRHNSDHSRRDEHTSYREGRDQPQANSQGGYGRQPQYGNRDQHARPDHYSREGQFEQRGHDHDADDEPQLSFGKFCRLTFFGSLIPGTGLIAAGRRLLGGFILTLCFLMIAAGAAAIILVPTTRLVSYGGDREFLLYAGVGLVAGGIAWMLIALITHRSLEPRGLSAGKRFVGSLMVVLAASVVVAPIAVAARNAFTQRDLIGAISSDDEDSKTTPEDIKKDDPWAKKKRLNLLLLGADVGKGRLEGQWEDVRPDTQIVASIDTQTGDTTMISLPRNLGNIPFPEESELYNVYPNGFVPPTGMPSTADPEYANWELNAIWKNVPGNTEIDVSPSDANKWAVEGVTGLDIDYFMMVNLDGFEAVVDALGGITIDVGEEVLVDYGEPDYPACSYRAETIDVGEQEMDGSLALQYARSRCGGTNYDRMDRQQCVMQGIVDAAKPSTLLTKYQSLARATKGMVKTDVPPDLFPPIIELTSKVQGGEMATMSLDHDFFNQHGGSPDTPDYEAVHTAVDRLINPEPKPTKTGAASEEPESPTASSEAPATDESTSDTSGSGEVGDPNEAEEEESTC